MKPVALSLVAAFVVSLAAACGPKSNGPAAVTPAPGVSPHAAEEEKNCNRSLTGPGKRADGEECGGATNISCAEGLTCVSKYKCMGAVGTCQKK